MESNLETVSSSFESKLQEGIRKSKLLNYVYGYPSKRAYREFQTPICIDDIWRDNEHDVNIYLHIPFCRQRCAYCTLFTTTKHTPELIDAYVEKMCEQLRMYSNYTNGHGLTSVYFGGGTPTTLSLQQFERVFQTIYRYYTPKTKEIEINVEGTPSDLTLPMLQALKSFGVNRVSIGVQTMHEEEIKKTGRGKDVVALKTLENIMTEFSNFNVDLIFGLPSQTRESWFMSLNKVLEFHPSVISLFPVVVRPSSNISKTCVGEELLLSDEDKFEIYDENVSILQERGYKQDCFTRFSSSPLDSFLQETLEFKGMPLIGIGAGARSYRNQYHYSTEYVVSNQESYEVVREFMSMQFDKNWKIYHGIILDVEEQKRRQVLLNLSLGGVIASDYELKFGVSPFENFGSEFRVLQESQCITIDNNNIRLTQLGYKFSSLIAQLFFSEKMKTLEIDL